MIVSSYPFYNDCMKQVLSPPHVCVQTIINKSTSDPMTMTFDQSHRHRRVAIAPAGFDFITASAQLPSDTIHMYELRVRELDGAHIRGQVSGRTQGLSSPYPFVIIVDLPYEYLSAQVRPHPRSRCSTLPSSMTDIRACPTKVLPHERPWSEHQLNRLARHLPHS
jgi:hypothetical protein